jgi:Zn ribbon nucleic-acid-binding protein
MSKTQEKVVCPWCGKEKNELLMLWENDKIIMKFCKECLRENKTLDKRLKEI